MKTLVIVGLVSVTSIVGCGSSDDDKPATPEGTPNKQSASSATTATITATQSAIKPAAGGANAGQASANQLSSAAQATQNLVTPSAGGTGAKSLPGLELADFLHPLENPAGTTGTCTCTADSCTFAACATGALTIDGTYAFGGGKIKTTDLKYTIKTGTGPISADVVINVKADLTVTATSMNGTFQSTGTTTTGAGGQSYSSSWDSSLDFKGVTYPSGGGAPTAGSVHIKASTSVSAGGAAQAYQSEFDVNFPGG